MISRNFTKFIAIFAAWAVPFHIALAGTTRNKILERFYTAGETSTIKGTSLAPVVGSLIKAVVGLSGVAALIIVIYAGILWIKAGTSDDIKDAKTLLRNGIIGLFIIIFAYAITDFIIDAFFVTSSLLPTQQPPASGAAGGGP